MKRLPWILLVAVVALVVLVFRHVSGNIGRGAEELLASARASAEAGDTGLVLGTLDTALELARNDGDDVLVEAILLERANLLTQRRAFPAARRDYETLLAMDPEDPPFVGARLVTLDVLAGDWRAGIESGLALVDEYPKYGVGRLQLARAYDMGADELYEAVEDYVSTVLPEEPAASALDALRRATNLPPGSPSQVEAFHDLLGVFDVEGVLLETERAEAVREVSRLRESARREFGASSRNKLGAPAAAALLESMIAAGHDGEASFLARYALGARQGNRRNADFIRSSLEAIIETGRGEEAADLAEEWYTDSGEGWISIQTLLSVGQALHAGQRWEAMGSVGQRLIDSAPSGAGARYFRDSGRFFAGLAAARSGDDVLAEEHLSMLRAPNANPSIEGGIRIAFTELARIARADDRLVDERTMLERLCNTFPREAGDAWARLAELHALTSSDPEEGLRALTQGMLAVPSRADDWSEAWYELARESFDRRGRDLEALASDIRNGRVTLQDLFVRETDGVLVVRELLDRGWPTAARYNGLILAEQLRDFPPLVELQFESCVAIGRFDEARDHAVQLLAWGIGGDTAGSFLRRSFEDGTTEPERIYDILREGSPELSALFFAAGLLEQGEYARVVEELAFFEEAHPDGDMELLEPVRARAHLALGRPAKALKALTRLPAESRAYADALPLHAQAVAAAPSDAAFATLLERIEGVRGVDSPRRIELAERMLERGHGAWAIELLDGATSEDIVTNARLFDLRALASLVEGDLVRAEEFVARGRAFSQDDEARFLELLFAVSRGDAEGYDAVAELIDPRTSPRQVRCALAVLRSDPILSRATLPSDVPEAPLRPLWSVLWRIADPALEPPLELVLDERVAREFERTFGGPVDDRVAQNRFAASVIAASSERLLPWLVQSLGRMDAREGLWQGYFAWLVERDSGDRATSVAKACELVEAFPFLLPVWIDLSATAAEVPSSDEALTIVRAFAARPDSSFAGRAQPPLLHVAGSALIALEKGRDEAALRSAREVAGAEGRHPVASLIAARVFAALGETDDALAAYAMAIELTANEAAPALLSEYLGVVVDAARDQRIEAGARTERVTALSERFAEDETLEAHRALSAVTTWREAAASAGLFDHAASLETLATDFEVQLGDRLARTGRPIGRAAAAVWAEAWLALDPERGAVVFERQLARGPTRLDLWLCHLDLLVASEAHGRAERLSARLAETVADPSVQRWRLRFVGRVQSTSGGRTSERLESVARRVAPEAPEAMEARLRLASAAGDAPAVRELGDALWTASASTPDAAVVAGLVAEQLLLLDERSDRNAAQTVLRGGLAARSSPAERAVLEVLADLAGLSR